jgi:NAD(P)-dependent dehydrogenase (short-subunit alcohol dehydrogenase family)
LAAALPWKTAWVTGASTGIGREIALQLAAAGVKVAASARSADKLADLGHGVAAYPLDVTDSAAVTSAIDRIESDIGPIDLCVLGAGAYTPTDVAALDPELFRATMTVNYMGVVNCLTGVVPRMMARGHGHVSWIASVAGYAGLPKAAAYGPSKAALINLGESLYPELKRGGVKVSVINPGFVETPLTAQNEFAMPFLMKANEAGRRSIAGLASGRFEVAYPRRFVAILKFARLLPYRLYFWLIEKAVLK